MAAVEQKKSYHVTKDFKGLNTKANRTAIQECDAYWVLEPEGHTQRKARYL
jgi:hypothetical protein